MDFLRVRTETAVWLGAVAREFGRQHTDETFYVAGLDLNVLYGEVLFSANTVEAFEQLVAESAAFRDYRPHELKLLKMSSPEWKHREIDGESPNDFGAVLEEIEKVMQSDIDDELYQRYRTSLKEAFSAGLADAYDAGAFDSWPKGSDFTLYSMDHDDNNDEWWTKRVLGEEPAPSPVESAAEEWIAQVASMPAPDRARIWVDTLQALLAKELTPTTTLLTEIGWTSYKVEEELVALGEAGLPAILEAMERVVLLPQLNEKDSEAWKKFGAMTPESRLYFSLLWVLQDANLTGDELRIQLVDQLKSLLEAAGPIGDNIQLNARTLHHLWPDRYPDAELGGDKGILNANDFIS